MSDKSECIRVFVRVRPPFSSELAKESVSVQGGDSVRLKYDRYDISCRYNRVFDKDSSQDAVFAQITPLLMDALAGVNCSVLAYGQTSAGKTHTMLGPDGGSDISSSRDSSWGLLPRSVFFVFDELRRRVLEGGARFQVKVSYMQIYNEIIHDLLRERIVIDDLDDGEGAQSGLKIREYVESSSDGGRKQEIFVSGLSEFRAETAEDVLGLLLLGSRNRSTRSTECNASSSRSHAILQLAFELEQQGADGQTVINRSKLSFVDLAGSEKILALGNDKDPKHLKELTSINKSLSSLGNVIAALSKGRPHVPYRDSKLTRLLQDSLGGNTRTLLIACVAPTAVHAAETFNTLQFADRASSVMVRVRPNVVIDDKALLVRAQVEVARLKRLLRFVMNGSGDKGPGAFSLEGAGAGAASGLGTELSSKQSAVLEAMAVGAHAVRAGGGDDEAAADSEMIRLLDENERLRKDNSMLQQRCHRLQARLGVYQNNGGAHQTGVWSPVKGPGTGHKKTKRSLTGGMTKRRGTKSNPYIAHLPKSQSGVGERDEESTQRRSAGPTAGESRGRSAGAQLHSAEGPDDSPQVALPAPLARAPQEERRKLFDPADPYGLGAQAERPQPGSGPEVEAEGGGLSPVRGVIRKKSRGSLSVAFSGAELEEAAASAEGERGAAQTPQPPPSGVRNRFAALAPVLSRAQQTPSKKKQAKKAKGPTGPQAVEVNKSSDRSNRIDQVRHSSEWAKSEGELVAVERDLEARGRLLDAQLREETGRLGSIREEKARLLRELRRHLDGAAAEGDSGSARGDGSPPAGRGSPERRASPGERALRAETGAAEAGAGSDLLSPTSAGVCRDYCTDVLAAAQRPQLSPARVTSRDGTAERTTGEQGTGAGPARALAGNRSNEDSRGNSFSSHVVAKALGGGGAATHAGPVSASYRVSPSKGAKNEPARLLNSELDVGRCLQMYSFRYDSWDTFDILDYNGAEKLHKCLFHSDRSQQWLNLKKKPIRGFALEEAPSVDDEGSGDEY